jgi:hypothetical protein
VTATALPAAIDNLLVILRAAAAASTIAVYDSLVPTDAPDRRYIIVGASDPTADDLFDAATTSQPWAYIGHNQRRETFTLHCIAVAWDGGEDLSACRIAATEVLALATTAIVADPSLNGAVLQTTIGNVALQQAYVTDGVYVGYPFDLECQAILA